MNFSSKEVSSASSKKRRRISVGDRDYHNALERKRRELISTRFLQLRDAIPFGVFGTNNRSERSSRCIILNTACQYVEMMEKTNAMHADDILQLTLENNLLQSKIAELKNGNAQSCEIKQLLLEMEEASQSNMAMNTKQVMPCNENQKLICDEALKCSAHWFNGNGLNEAISGHM
ncbi:protein max-like [Hydractinia symbiolongicarpus]|uniref:protein max-like n=1 Tax=Hydractinia symbiolongicarpus TaxID=13093 RepID=UPI00254A98CA|nr:protein max-like [Hydractinia symbiolongicarpus]